MSSQSQILKRLEASISMMMEEKIRECANMYGFNAEEAVSRLLDVTVVEKKISKSSSLTMPFVKSGVKEKGCGGLEYNHGLFTQCCNERVNEGIFCGNCEKDNSEKGYPSAGLVSDRIEKGLMEFRDPSGRKPISYLNYLKKKNTSIESARSIASELGLDIEEHLLEVDSKRGRPKKEEKEASTTSSQAKAEKRGRPKKVPTKVETEKIVDLFASTVDEILETSSSVSSASSLASESNNEVEVDVSEVLESEPKKNAKSQDAEKDAKKKALEEEKEAKKKALEEEKEAKKKALEEEKEAKKKALEAEKEAKKKALEEEKEAKKKALEEEKEAKKKALEEEKEAKKKALEAEKNAKKKAKSQDTEKELKNQEKESKKQTNKANNSTSTSSSSSSSSSSTKVEEVAKPVEKAKVEERPKVQVSEFVYEGITYWKSTDNIMYEPTTKEVKGVWSEKEKKMLPAPEESDDELSEEEYEDEDEDDDEEDDE